MDAKTLFVQVKSFILSNEKILDALNGNIIQEDWKEGIFYAVSNNEITDWKENIGYKKICEEIHKRGNKNLITDEDEEWCCSLIEKNIKGKKLAKKSFGNSTIYTSLFSTINIVNFNDSKNHISPNTYFYLISKELWELFGLAENKEYSGIIPIMTGKNKILIKLGNNKIILLKLNDNNSRVDSLNLEKYLIQYIINFDNSQKENEISKLVEKIKNMDVKDFENKNNYLLIDDMKLNIQTKHELDITFNVNIKSILKNSQNDNKNKEELEEEIKNSFQKRQSIKDVNYICKTIVRKIKHSTYVIASMYSLSQIPQFTDYFFCNENNLLFNSELLFYFSHYIHNLWRDTFEESIFEPIYFLHCLSKKNKDIFDFKKEKQPIIFLDKMFDYINEELNNEDFIISKQLEETKKEFLNKYNSIVSKVFYGLLKQRNICISCGQAKNNSLENDMFKYINIDIIRYSNEESKLDNSLTYYYLDDLIDFYFTKQMNLSYCQNCKEKKEFKIINKQIDKFPDILIINIDWGQFNEEEGFGLEENKLIFNEIIDLTKYAYKNQNQIKYELRSVINYPIIHNGENKLKRKYVTFSKHLVNQKFYCYQPGVKVTDFNSKPNTNIIDLNLSENVFDSSRTESYSINRRSFVPSVLFYEKMKLKNKN